jgi:hypothetical protein
MELDLGQVKKKSVPIISVTVFWPHGLGVLRPSTQIEWDQNPVEMGSPGNGTTI